MKNKIRLDRGYNDFVVKSYEWLEKIGDDFRRHTVTAENVNRKIAEYIKHRKVRDGGYYIIIALTLCLYF